MAYTRCPLLTMGRWKTKHYTGCSLQDIARTYANLPSLSSEYFLTVSLSKPDRSRFFLRSGASLLEALIDFQDVSRVLRYVKERGSSTL